MSPSSLPPSMPADVSAAGFKNCSRGLTFFGVLTLLAGLGWGYLGVVSVIRRLNALHFFGVWNNSVLLSDIGFFGVTALVLICLGIGSIRAKPWARRGLMTLSWVLLSFVLLDYIASSRGTGGCCVVLFASRLNEAFFILMLTAWALFYGNRQVKLTCDRRHARRHVEQQSA